MSEIIIKKKEISFLQKEIDRKLRSENINLKWNSNPTSYMELVEVLPLRENGKKVGPTFLRDLFYKPNDSKNTRIDNVNALYQFLYLNNRDEYLNEHSINFASKPLYVFHPRKLLTEDVKRIPLEEGNYKIKWFSSAQEVIILAKTKSARITFFIDDMFIKDFNGAELLIRLFCEEYIRLIIDYDISFIFDGNSVFSRLQTDSLLPNIDTIEGRLGFVKYWLEKKRDFEELNLLSQELESDFSYYLEKFTSMEFVKTLEYLNKFMDENNSQEKSSIKNLLPLLKNIDSKSQIKPLRSIYEDSAENNGEEYNFLCVIGYEGYFNELEQKEMVKYFSLFRSKLNKANIIRVFTVPAKRVKGIGWRSTLPEKLNISLYQYIAVNVKNGVQTYLLYYDEENCSEHKKIMWNQDYVIRIDKYDTDTFNSLEKTTSLLTKYIIEKKDFWDNMRLYFAYTETSDGENRTLEVYKTSHKRRMLSDFINRSSLFKKEKQYAYLEHINELKLANLNVHLGLLEKKIHHIETDIQMYL